MTERLVRAKLIGNPQKGIYVYSLQIPDNLQPDEHIMVDFEEPIPDWALYEELSEGVT